MNTEQDFQAALSAVRTIIFQAHLVTSAARDDKPDHAAAVLGGMGHHVAHAKSESIAAILAVVEHVNRANRRLPVVNIAGIKAPTVHDAATRIGTTVYHAARNAVIARFQKWSYTDEREAGGKDWHQLVPEAWEQVSAALKAIPEIDHQHALAVASKENDEAIESLATTEGAGGSRHDKMIEDWFEFKENDPAPTHAKFLREWNKPIKNVDDQITSGQFRAALSNWLKRHPKRKSARSKRAQK